MNPISNKIQKKIVSLLKTRVFFSVLGTVVLNVFIHTFTSLFRCELKYKMYT